MKVPIYQNYLLKFLGWPTALILFCLTAIIWLTQALRFVDFIINRGLSTWDFLKMTALIVPSLLVILLPVSLFVAVIYAYFRLTADSELIVMRASGLSPMQLARPALLAGLAVTLVSYLNVLVVLPSSQRHFHRMQDFLRDNYSSILLQEEVFNHPADGMTVFIRSRESDGTLKGIVVHDNRNSRLATTMMAETGQLVQTSSGPRFLLGHGLRQENRGGRLTWLDFDSYNLDLTFYTRPIGAADIDEKDLSLAALFRTASNEPAERGRMLAEAHRRLTWPLYSTGLALLAAATLLGGEFSRRTRWRRIAVLIVTALAVVLLSFGLTSLVTRLPMLSPTLYVVAFAVCLGGLWMLKREGRDRLVQGIVPARHSA